MDTKSMMLVHSMFNEKKTFRILPVTQDAPYAEAIYDVDSKVLVIIGKTRKTGLHMMPKLDDNGDPMEVKNKIRPNGSRIKEERRTYETFYEYYIQEEKDILDIVELMCVNGDSFDYQSYMKDPVKEEPKA